MKGILTVFIGLLMVFGLAGCTVDKSVDETQDINQINEMLKSYYGTYIAGIDPNDIVIDNQGIWYGGNLIDIVSISQDHYVKIKNSNAIFILDIGMVMTNIANPKEAGQLITYDITSPNVTAEIDEKEALINDKLKGYVGKYQSNVDSSTFEFIDPYQIINIEIDTPIYYVDGQKNSILDKSNVFNDTDVMVQVDGALIVNLKTQDDCSLNVIFGVNNTIYLTVTKDSQVYTSLFNKIQ